ELINEVRASFEAQKHVTDLQAIKFHLSEGRKRLEQLQSIKQPANQSGSQSTRQSASQMVLDAFQQRKAVVLAGLQADCGDKSRKGSVDAPVAVLVSRINSHPAVYTTSSCSGRITVFGEPTSETRAGGKKGGEWVYASHDPADAQDVISAIHARCVSGARLVLRFEPFILALEASSAAMGQQVLAAARAAGFRESGLTLGSGGRRVMVGVRCSLRLEVPVADAGAVLVPDTYLTYLVGLANDKFQQNLDRIRRFEQELFLALGNPAAAAADGGDAEAGTVRQSVAQAALRQPPTASADPGTMTAAPSAVTNSDAGAMTVAAAPARRRRGNAPAGAGGTIPDAALKALKRRQAQVLGRIRALELRLQVKSWGRQEPEPGPGSSSSSSGVAGTQGTNNRRVATAGAGSAGAMELSLESPGAPGSTCLSLGGALRWRPVASVSPGQ
ncbi:hypothetical protein VOLCADRAFT_118079, partial [Volvox carteri f. nagariensis]